MVEGEGNSANVPQLYVELGKLVGAEGERDESRAYLKRGLELAKPLNNFRQSDAISPKHGAAPINRPVIAKNGRRIDIGCPKCNAFFEYLRAFIDHWIKKPCDNILV